MLQKTNVTPYQEQFIRSNYHRLNTKQMAEFIPVTHGRIMAHITMWGLSRTPMKEPIIDIPITSEGFFDEVQYGKMAII